MFVMWNDVKQKQYKVRDCHAFVLKSHYEEHSDVVISKQMLAMNYTILTPINIKKAYLAIGFLSIKIIILNQYSKAKAILNFEL